MTDGQFLAQMQKQVTEVTAFQKNNNNEIPPTPVDLNKKLFKQLK